MRGRLITSAPTSSAPTGAAGSRKPGFPTELATTSVSSVKELVVVVDAPETPHGHPSDTARGSEETHRSGAGGGVQTRRC
jgi:hypothetical protein